jgi:hypothetical protein
MPSRFPVGTKFVIEACPRAKGRPPVYTRHIELPDGTTIRLPEPTIATRPAVSRRSPPRAIATCRPKR